MDEDQDQESELTQYYQLGLVVRMKEDEEVHVEETTLLKFDGMDHCNHCPKEAIMDFLQESILLFLKNTCDNVRTIRGLLLSPSMIGAMRWRNFLQQLVLYLWPVWIVMVRKISGLLKA